MKASKPFICAMTAAMVATPVATLADDDDELQYEEAYVYFELNDTDGDFGLHGKVDGDGWERVKIEGPDDRKFLDLEVKSGLGRQGMTELFFESSEPTFDELDPEVFFPRFPEGGYEWEGKTLDNEEIEGEAWLSHIIPAAPVVATVGGSMGNPGFEIDEEDEVAKACWAVTPDVNGDVVVSWYAVEKSHADMWDVDPQPLLPHEDLRYGGEDQPEQKIPLGVAGELPEVLYYEFVAEVDDTDHKMTAVVPADTLSWTIPAEFLAFAEEGEVKVEIIVRVASGGGLDDDGEMIESGPGNQSAVEDCFEF